MQSHVKGCLTESPGKLQQESTCRGVRRGELQLPNRGAVKDDRDDRDGVCHPQLGGCTPQLPAKGSHASTRHSAQPQTGSKTQALRAWWVLFKQKYRGVQISQEEMLGENIFTTLPPPIPCSSPESPKKQGGFSSACSHCVAISTSSLIWTKELHQALFYWKSLYFNSP